MTATDLDFGAPSAEFYRQFPDGVVPIRFGIGTSALGIPNFSPERMAQVRQIFCDEYERTMEAFDLITDLGFDMDELSILSESYHDSEVVSDKDPTRAHVVARMMQLGLTLEQIARYLFVEPAVVVNDLSFGKGSFRVPAEVVLHADWALAQNPLYPTARLARELHVDRELVRTLKIARAEGRAGGRRGCGTRSHNGVMGMNNAEAAA